MAPKPALGSPQLSPLPHVPGSGSGMQGHVASVAVILMCLMGSMVQPKQAGHVQFCLEAFLWLPKKAHCEPDLAAEPSEQTARRRRLAALAAVAATATAGGTARSPWGPIRSCSRSSGATNSTTPGSSEDLQQRCSSSKSCFSTRRCQWCPVLHNPNR